VLVAEPGAALFRTSTSGWRAKKSRTLARCAQAFDDVLKSDGVDCMLNQRPLTLSLLFSHLGAFGTPFRAEKSIDNCHVTEKLLLGEGYSTTLEKNSLTT
jgi:hypothetical protein